MQQRRAAGQAVSPPAVALPLPFCRTGESLPVAIGRVRFGIKSTHREMSACYATSGSLEFQKITAQSRRDTETGLVQLAECIAKIDPAALCSRVQDSKCACYVQGSPDGFAPAGEIVHEDRIPSRLQRQQYRIALAWI